MSTDHPDDHLAPQAAEVLLRGMDPERRESGLRLDRHGVWHHEGVAVTHERLAKALFRWLDRHPGSDRFVLRPTDELWAWVDVEDAPFQATLTGLTADGGLALQLSDGTEEIFGGSSIAVGDDDAWYVPVRGGRFEARLARGAMVHLADHLTEDDAAPDGVALHLPGGRRITFGARQR